MAVMSIHGWGARTLGVRAIGAAVLRAAIFSMAIALPATAQKARSPDLGASAPKARPSLSAATAGTVSVDYLKGKLPVAPDAVGTTGAQLFGDNVNLYNGAISFEQTDVSLPGNSALPVAVVRSYSPRPWWEGVRGALGDWDLNTPRIEGTFTRDFGFVPAYGGPESRCSGFNMPPDVSVGGQSFANFEYWQGTHLIVPGQGSQEVLRRNGAFTRAAAFPLVTRNLWGISCANNVLNGPGEGFIATSPQGVQYIFNWIATRNQSSLRKGDGVLTRQDWMLMATKVIDRFGKFVEYAYDPANPLLLTRISSSDGRAIDLRYVGGRLDSVFDGTRTWLYRYGTQGDLQNVVLPDGSRWTFDLRAMVYVDSPGNDAEVDCDTIPTPPAGIYKGTMWHPSGAKGEFETAFASQAKTDVPRVCTYILGTTWTNGSIYPRVTNNQALFRKTISGPGLPTLTWRYDVSNGLWPEWGSCASCPDRKLTVVTHPDGNKTRYHFGIRWRINEGQLLQTDEGWDGTQFLRTTTINYRDAAGQAYPSHFGESVNALSDQVSHQNRPMESKVINQQGTQFEWTAAAAAVGFDELARPRTTTRRSSLGFTRTDTVSYQDDWSHWILGSVNSVVEHSTGLTVEAIAYNAMMLPEERKSFGLTTETYVYYEDGNPYEIKNAGGRSLWLGSYVRGQPTYATFADGAQEKQETNNLGMPEWRDNAAGTRHRYAYDEMGRVSQIVYPTGDLAAYNPTNVRFEQTGGVEFGLAAGHWRQSIWTGSGFTIRYFDGFWRERLRWTFDATPDRKDSTSSYVETRYDHDGRKTFVSYPQRTFEGVDDSPIRVPGVRTSYDSLGRVILEARDSELGPLRTVTRYLPVAFQKEVKNPREHVTTFAFQAFDTPTEDALTEIWAPEGVNVKINRDVFGKARYISRGGPDGGGTLSATRWYVYEPDHQRLCKTIEPESGATVQAYDASGNVAWKASGLPLPDITRCDRDSVSPDRKITFGYDLRERLTTSDFGDNSQKITRTYTPDSLLQSVETTGGGRNPIKWQYDYNNRRILAKETYTWGDPNNNWAFHWGINENGHVGGLSDPWGWIGYGPNALGQPTVIGSYASGITFAPNGALSGYRLGNNVTFNATQSVRGLTEEWRHGHLVHDRYTYDKNGNVQQIEDLVAGRHRNMPVYDGLDRLVQAHGPWGTGIFTYDALDNITSSQIGSRSLTHRYDRGSNRLTDLLGSMNVAMGYDPNGNVNYRVGVYHHFDIGNRLLHVDGRAGYAYDGHGRRNLMWFADGTYAHQAYTNDGKLRFSWKLGPWGKRHVWLGDTLIAEHDQTGTITYVHADALGSPVVRSDVNGSEIASTRSMYEPYGAVMAGTSNESGIGFTGHVNDPDTGLVYMQQRYYDPLAGRFLSVDPVVANAATGSSFNRYKYAENNPYRYIDPDGRCSASRIGTEPGSICGGSAWGLPASTVAAYQAALVRHVSAGVSQAAEGAKVTVLGTISTYVRIKNWILSQGANSEGGASNSGDKDPSTPTGQRGSPIEVKPGTNEPTNIGGRDYSGHALDRMQGRGVPPSAVEDAIQNGTQSPGNTPGTTVHTGSNGVTVVTGNGGRVVTVIPR